MVNKDFHYYTTIFYEWSSKMRDMQGWKLRERKQLHQNTGVETARNRNCGTMLQGWKMRYVARTPPVEARSPGRSSNVENAGQLATPTSYIRRAILRTPHVTRQSPASSVHIASYRGMDASL